MVARATVLLTGWALALVLASSAQAAAPDYILVSGPGLVRPVLLANWNENHDLLLALAVAPRARGAQVRGLGRRRSLDVAEFWGWSGKPRPTKASQANQHGRFYPADGTHPAVIVLTVNGNSFPRLVTAKVRSVFVRHGIPLRLQDTPGRESGEPCRLLQLSEHAQPALAGDR